MPVPRTKEIEAWGSEVQGFPGLYSKFKAGMGYMRFNWEEVDGRRKEEEEEEKKTKTMTMKKKKSTMRENKFCLWGSRLSYRLGIVDSRDKSWIKWQKNPSGWFGFQRAELD